MYARMLAALVLMGAWSTMAAAQTAEQFVEITALPRATTTYRVAAVPAPATALPAPALPSATAGPVMRYDGAPVTTYAPATAYPPTITYGTPVTAYRAPGVVQAGYAPTVPLQPVPATGTYTTLPPYTTNMVSTQPAPYKPIVALSSAPTNGIVGQGIIGQPKLYMPNQPVRNFVRWLMP